MKKSRLFFLIILVVVLLLVACQKTGNVVKKEPYKMLEPKKAATLKTPSEGKTSFNSFTYDASCASKYCCTLDGGDRSCLKCCDSAVQKDTGESKQNKKEDNQNNYVSRLSNYFKKLFRK